MSEKRTLENKNISNICYRPIGTKSKAGNPPKLPVRFQKGSSQLSLTSKRKIRCQPQEYALSSGAAFQEITRLISLNDEQNQLIKTFQAEIKTLKIVNQRQERGLKALDSTQQGYPELFRTMNEELRVARIERQKSLEKVVHLEKHAVNNAREQLKLQTTIHKFKAKLKELHNPNLEQLKNELDETRSQLAAAELALKEVSSNVSILKSEKTREVSFAKQKYVKLLAEVSEAKKETFRLVCLLKDKERIINNPSPLQAKPISPKPNTAAVKGNERFINSPSPSQAELISPKTENPKVSFDCSSRRKISGRWSTNPGEPTEKPHQRVASVPTKMKESVDQLKVREVFQTNVFKPNLGSRKGDEEQDDYPDDFE